MINNKLLLTLVGTFTLLNGLGGLFSPELFLSPVGVMTDADGLLSFRYFGASTVGLSMIFLLARSWTDWNYVKVIHTGGLLTFGIASLVGAHATIIGTMNTMGWAVSGIDALIAVVFAYFLFVRKSA